MKEIPDPETIVAHSEYPPPEKPLALGALLRAVDNGGNEPPEEGSHAKAFEIRAARMADAAAMESIPIVGVCGTINSGKSTVVAGFLSDAGAARVLVGELDSEGTHRFVFWLPESWKNNGLAAHAREMIARAAGCQPEDLSEKPEEARRQYNATSDRAIVFNIPLIAFDSRLDEAGIAFLDCPDIQRSLDETIAGESAHLRLDRLRTLTPLCSAFVMVNSMQQGGAETVGRVFDALKATAANAPVYFVLNMTKSADHVIYKPEADKIIGRWEATDRVKRVYLAPFVRTNDPHEVVKPEIVSADENHAPLIALARELDPAELQKKHRASCARRLADLLRKVEKTTAATQAKQLRTCADARGRIRQFIAGKFIDDHGRLRALEPGETANRLAASLKRSAPIYVRAAQAPGDWFRNVFHKFKRREATSAELAAYERMDAGDFSAFLSGSRFLPLDATTEQLDAVWRAAAGLVKQSSAHHGLNDEELDAITRRLWSEVPLKQKLKLMSNVMIAMAVIGVGGLMLPFDGGATLVVSTKAHLILGGGEIIAMLVGGTLVGTLMSMKGVGELVTLIEREAARPQLDALYAGLSDGLGVPRSLPDAEALEKNGKVCHKFQPVKAERLPVVIDVPGGPILRIDTAEWNAMMIPLEAASRDS